MDANIADFTLQFLVNRYRVSDWLERLSSYYQDVEPFLGLVTIRISHRILLLVEHVVNEGTSNPNYTRDVKKSAQTQRSLPDVRGVPGVTDSPSLETRSSACVEITTAYPRLWQFMPHNIMDHHACMHIVLLQARPCWKHDVDAAAISKRQQ